MPDLVQDLTYSRSIGIQSEGLLDKVLTVDLSIIYISLKLH